MSVRLLSGSQLSVAIAEVTNVGECRRAAKTLGERFGFGDEAMGRISIIVSEIATNIVRHAGAGTVLLQVLDDGVQLEFELLGIDSGPGMDDVSKCMADGFSTIGTPGTGLGAISRLSTAFDLYSQVGKGTVVLSRSLNQLHAPRARAGARPRIAIGAINLAVAGETVCGDTWRAAINSSNVAIMVADGLGHGPLAATASRAAAELFVSNPFESPAITMTQMHRALSGTRGAAASCALLNLDNLTIDYAGVGNISCSIVTDGLSRGLVSHNGTLGVRLLRTQQFHYDWPARSHVVMHSDGLSNRWSSGEFPNLYQHHPGIIAGVLFRNFMRTRDDVTVLVAGHC